MNKEFVKYEQSLALKELGFDEPCFGYYRNYGTNKFYIEFIHRLPKRFRSTKAPLYQQVFRWLYLKLDIKNGTMPLDKEAQESLLKELIDKLSSKHLLV